MKVIEKFYLDSRKQELDSIPSFLPSENNAREISEVVFILTDSSDSNNIAVPFAVVINIYRLTPIFVRTKNGKVLVGWKYRFRQQLYIAPVVSKEVIDLPRYLLEYIDGLEEFLIPPQ